MTTIPSISVTPLDGLADALVKSLEPVMSETDGRWIDAVLGPIPPAASAAGIFEHPGDLVGDGVAEVGLPSGKVDETTSTSAWKASLKA